MNEWFMPTDLMPVAGGVYRAFPPAGMAGFTGPYDVDVLEVVEHQRFRMRWRGEQLHSEVLWEMSDGDPGVSLAVTQSGFLGLEGDQRRTELAGTYETMFREKLPEALAALAEPLKKKPPKAKPPRRPRQSRVRVDPGDPWWRKLTKLTQIPTERRGRLLSIAGAMVITGLIGSALAVVMARPPATPPGLAANGPSTGQAAQSGVQPGVTLPPSSAPSPSRAAQRVDAGVAAAGGATVSYRTSERFQLGYIGSITVTAGTAPISDWSAVVDLPNRATVTSAWDQIDYEQERRRVTFTPGAAHRDIGAGQQFTFYFQVGDPTESGRPQACAVNDQPCAGLSG